MNVTSLDSRRADTKTVYLVAHIDTSVTPPRIVGAGIYGEQAASLSGAIGHGRFAVDILKETGPNFEEAQRRVVEMPEPWRSFYAWALDLLPDSSPESPEAP